MQQKAMNILRGFVILVVWGNTAGNFTKDSLKSMCPPLKLTNGRVKYPLTHVEEKPRVEFKCNSDFHLFGEKTATCLSVTRLSAMAPFCARAGCPQIRSPAGGNVTRLEEGMVLRFECGAGMYRKGPQQLLCDGHKWNGDPPDCISTTPDCDFDERFLCGWAQDFDDHHDWQWTSKATPIEGMGPIEDYKGKDDHYMLIDNAFPNKERHVTRLISPMLRPSSCVCMTVDYQMRALDSTRDVGFLEIHIKTAKKQKLEVFRQKRDMGNKWFKGVTTIPAQVSDFQVIISATRGNSSMGYMALDNIKFSSCAEHAARTLTSTLSQCSEEKRRKKITPVQMSSKQNPTKATPTESLMVDSPRPITPPDGVLRSSEVPLTAIITGGWTESSSLANDITGTISTTADITGTISTTADTVVRPSSNADTRPRDNTSLNDDERQSTSSNTQTTPSNTQTTPSNADVPISTTVTTSDSVNVSVTGGLAIRVVTQVADSPGINEARKLEVRVSQPPSVLSSPHLVSSPTAADPKQIQSVAAISTAIPDLITSDLRTPDRSVLTQGSREKGSGESKDHSILTFISPKSNPMAANTPEKSQTSSFSKITEWISSSTELSDSFTIYDVTKTTAISSTTDKNEYNFDKGNDHIDNYVRSRKQDSGQSMKISDYLPVIGTISCGLFLGMLLTGIAAWKWVQNQQMKFQKQNNESTET